MGGAPCRAAGILWHDLRWVVLAGVGEYRLWALVDVLKGVDVRGGIVTK